ncbi:EAL and HDOD domain-containing protein [Thiobacillus denitrificans]|uniref:Diguanylate phosphodiesterase n=1 Tax=Thiobacillus denitrificans TaxID=36861 RepID=A0A125BCI4_THIDE|nr:EAL domain-containing protein [Thiobacillus denitrificans]KVW95614.1 diguanylate phosphodiesterase [Thiobacillus denitrificans]
MATRDIFLGRQPILDRDQRLVAYELLFRTADTSCVTVTDDMHATASVIQHAFSEMGVQTVLGTQLGFINVSADMLLSDMVELLPKAQVVLELLETIIVTDAVVERCRALKQQGFTLALDDFLFTDSHRPLLALVDIVKIDLLQHSQDELRAAVSQLKPWPVKLLAEKVDSAEQAAYCHALGFDLFQGYFFARPAVLSAKRTDPSQMALIQMLGMVMRDAETAQIEQVFKQHPNLTYNLIRLVNSVAIGAQRSIASVSQALMVLGRKQLQRWLQLLLFTLQTGSAYPSPLLALAATRGKMMELLAMKQQRNADYCDEAFMAGILSLIETLIAKPLADIVGELNLNERLAAALLRREGELGTLLQLVESVEHPNLGHTLSLLAQSGTLSLSDLTAAEIEAMSWANQVAEATA